MEIPRKMIKNISGNDREILGNTSSCYFIISLMKSNKISNLLCNNLLII